MLPGADDEVVVPVLIDIARIGGADAESVSRLFTGQCQQALAVGAGVNIDAPGLSSERVIRPVGGINVGDTVGVHVAHDGNEHASELRPSLLGVDYEIDFTGRAGVDVSAPLVLGAGVWCAYDDELVVAVEEPRGRAPEAIPRLFTR